jgi:hypothetical protein
MSDFEITQPTPEELRELVKSAGLTRGEAAELVHVTKRAWDKWTTKEGSPDHRNMPLAAYELLLIKLGEHPIHK